jgi:hypothetical protein
MKINELRKFLDTDRAKGLFYGNDVERLKKSLNEVEKYLRKKDYDKDVLIDGYKTLWGRITNIVDKKHYDVFYSFVNLVRPLDRYKELNYYKEKIYQIVRSHKSIEALNTRMETLDKTPINRYKENPTIQLSKSFINALEDKDID